MSDVNIETLSGTFVKTLYTTVEKGTLDDGSKYEKRQATAPRTLMEAVTDSDGKHLDDVLEGMQIQIDKATTDIKAGINDVIDERVKEDVALKSEIYVFNHNSLCREKFLGTSVTEAQWAAIKSGTFDDLYIGDYWTINGINWRIAAFDYYLNTGDARKEHHAVIVPDAPLYSHSMNDEGTTVGGYTGSKMYQSGLEAAKATVADSFGSDHIFSHKQLLSNAVTNGYVSGYSWYDSTVELMTERNVYGNSIFSNFRNGTEHAGNQTIDKSQFPLFAFKPNLQSAGGTYWLRDIATNMFFARVITNGTADAGTAATALGVRPAFCIYQS